MPIASADSVVRQIWYNIPQGKRMRRVSQGLRHFVQKKPWVVNKRAACKALAGSPPWYPSRENPPAFDGTT